MTGTGRAQNHGNRTVEAGIEEGSCEAKGLKARGLEDAGADFRGDWGAFKVRPTEGADYRATIIPNSTDGKFQDSKNEIQDREKEKERIKCQGEGKRSGLGRNGDGDGLGICCPP